MKKFNFNSKDFPDWLITETPVVYVIRGIGSDFYKIGYAKNMKQRLSNIQSGCPYSLSLIHTAHAPNYKEVEKYLHNTFSHKNVRGEWFLFNCDDLDEIYDFFYELNRSIRLAIRGK